MDAMADRLSNMKLSVAERKKIEVGEARRSGTVHQALGKLLSEKLAHPDALERALGKVWCPIKGIECKSLGENKFLFTFFQAFGKRRALEERPWVFSNELLVMADLDETKAIDEIEFHTIPIWIRVMKLPVGLMNKAAGEAIGNEVGEFLEAEVDGVGVMVNSFLHIKVRLDIRKPLMRGATMSIGKDGREKWCPLVYEYLPDFCYTCGLLGHTDNICAIKLKKGEVRQYNGELRWTPPKFRYDQDGNSRKESRSDLSGRSNSSGGWGGRWGNTSTRSDALTWRKSGEDGSTEVTSPLKEKGSGSDIMVGADTRRSLFAAGSSGGQDGETTKMTLAQEKEKLPIEEGAMQHVKSSMQVVKSGQMGSQENFGGGIGGDGKQQEAKKEEENRAKGRKFKRQPRAHLADVSAPMEVLAQGKRSLDEDAMDIEDDGVVVKKARRDEVEKGEEINTNLKAGLSEQPCKKQ